MLARLVQGVEWHSWQREGSMHAAHTAVHTLGLGSLFSAAKSGTWSPYVSVFVSHSNLSFHPLKTIIRCRRSLGGRALWSPLIRLRQAFSVIKQSQRRRMVGTVGTISTASSASLFCFLTVQSLFYISFLWGGGPPPPPLFFASFN